MPTSAEHLDRSQACLLPRQAAVLAVHLADLVADGQHRVQRRERVLEDQAHGRAPKPSALLRAGPEQVVSSHRQGVGGDLGRCRVVQSHDRPRRDRLAGPGLAEQGQELAAADIQVHIPDGAEGPRRLRKLTDRPRTRRAAASALVAGWAGRSVGRAVMALLGWPAVGAILPNRLTESQRMPIYLESID